ncbi:MAG: 2TM domain-containing protein [Desulfobacteraceae bacterium]
MEEQETYQRAKRRVEAKIGFYIHLGAYLGMNIVLLIINLVVTPGYLWVKWPIIGWGIGVLFHGLGVFVFSKGFSFKERMIEKELRKESMKKLY